MNDLPARNAKLATILGRVSLGLSGLSVVFVCLGYRFGFMVLAFVPVVASVGLIVGLWSMVVRRGCLHPRPESPRLALLVSVVACCFYAYWAYAIFGITGMHH
jgi:hypothetical protein